MSDREMMAGFRTFFSGGARCLDTQTLQKIITTASKALVVRNEKVPVMPTIHIVHDNGLPACGTYLATHYRRRTNKETIIDNAQYYSNNTHHTGEWELLPVEDDVRFTTDVREATCGTCRSSSAYKRATDPSYTKSPKTIGATHFPVARGGYWMPACKQNSRESYWNMGSILLFPNHNVSPHQVTCKSCKKTLAYRHAIEQTPESSTPEAAT